MLSPKDQTLYFMPYVDESDQTLDYLLQSCDSVIAVLNDTQLDSWLTQFTAIAEDEEAADYCDFGTATVTFDIDGKTLVLVSDSGGELATGDFQTFCEEHNIDCQFIIDSPDCEDIDVEDIYTGEMNDNITLLTLLHKVYNS